MTNVRWILIFWMFLVSAIGYLDRVNISIAGGSIAQEFHLSNIQLGAVFSAFVLGYALFQAPAGAVADRFGPRRVLTLGVVWWGIFTAAITFISPSAGGLLFLLVAVRFCLGMGEAVIYPASNCIVANWIPSAERGRANGIIFAGVGFGAGVTSPLIAYLLVHYGWRSSFWVSAAAGFAAGLAWYFVACDTPEQHPKVSTSELEFIHEALPQNRPRAQGNKLGWRGILSSRDVLALTFSYFAYGYAAYIFFSWFFIYLSTARGLNLRESSYYTMLPFIAMATCSPLGGWISDRVMKQHGPQMGRCGVAGAAIVLWAIFIGMGGQVQNVVVATLVLGGGAGALYLSQSSFWSVSADIVDHHEQRIYGWSQHEGLTIERDSPLDAVNLAFDKAGDLMVLSSAGPEGTVYSFHPGSPTNQIAVLTPQEMKLHSDAMAVLPVNYWNNGEFKDQLNLDTLTYTTLTEMCAQDVSTPKTKEYVSPDGSIFLPAGRVFQQGPPDYTGWRFSANLDTYGFISALPGASDACE